MKSLFRMNKQLNESICVGFLNMLHSGTFDFTMINMDDREIHFTAEDELLRYEVRIIRKHATEQDTKNKQHDK